MEFAILTDTHLVPSGHTLYALDPAARLATAIDVINADHPDIAFIMICGDLAHRGDRPSYEQLQSLASRSRIPVRLMMGNHDRRTPFREVFESAGDDGNGYVQWAESFEAFSLIALDTLNEEGATDAGLLCEKRLAFLRAALSSAPTDRPLLLFQHHPPFDIGLPSMDCIKLVSGAEELAVLSEIRKPDYLFLGHVHRPVGGHWHGMPFHIQRGLIHQVDFDLHSAAIPGTHELPDYALVVVAGDQLVVHPCSFLYDGPRYWLADRDAETAAAPDELKR